MTMTESARDTRDTASDTDPSDERQAARDYWHASGGTATGKEIAEHFRRSPRWGQDRAAEAREEAAARGNGTPILRAVPAAPAPPRQAPRPPAARPDMPRHTPKPPSRGKTPSATVQRVTAAAVALVAVVAAAASYSHMHALALEAGEGSMARALPLSVDGLVVAATMTLLSARRAGRQAGVLPWLALLLGLGASLAANVAAAEPTVVGRLVAAWPPVALALSFELLLRQTRGERS